MMKFTGILPALVTPFCEDNYTINQKSTRELLDLLLSQGANGFYILGGTGEGIVLTREQREVMCETVVKHIAGRKPIINHIAASNINEAITLAKSAEKSGCDAIAAIPPNFFYYSEDDIYEYYKRIAGSVHIPLIIYYHPAAQKDMSAKLFAHIFEIDNVTGVKWSSNNFFEMMKLKDITHGEMNIINGPDELLVSGLAAGADAGIGSTYNVMLPQFVKIYDCFQKGELKEALKTQMKVNRIIEMMIKSELIPAVKHTVGMMGIDVGDSTFPMKKYSHDEILAYEASMEKVGWPL